MQHREPRALGHEPALDGVRAFAVMTVVVWHFGPIYNEGPLSWMSSGHLGVDLFFVLSGFLITALMLKEQHQTGAISFQGFYRRRVFRLLPALLFFLVGHLIFALTSDVTTTAFSPGTELSNEIPSLLGAQFFVLNLLHHVWDFNITLGMAHLWSLSVEEQFYLVWPTVMVLVLSGRAQPSRLISLAMATTVALTAYAYTFDELATLGRIAVTTALAAAVVGALEALRRRHNDLWIMGLFVAIIVAVNLYRVGFYDDPLSLFTLYSHTLSRADQLVMGALLAVLWTGGWIPRRAPAAVNIAGWLVLLWAIWQQDFTTGFYPNGGWTVVALAAAAIIWGSLDAADTAHGKLLSIGWVRSIGKVAYGLYLWHGLMLEVVEVHLGDQSVWLRAVLGLGSSALITAISWHFLEKPMLAFKKPKAERNAAVPTSV